MKTYIKLAWRNLWRNKRRTLITMASIIFSVFFASLMRSFQEGMYNSMIDNAVKFYSGYLQIQDSAFWDDKTLDNSIFLDQELARKISEVEDVELLTPRIESGALAAFEDKSKPIIVMGINPEKEDEIVKLSDKIVKGKLISSEDNGIIVTEGLANFLKIGIKDTLVLWSQGYHGISAAAMFPVRAILKHSNQQFNNRMVYLSLKSAQEFYSLGDLYTSAVIMVNDHYGVGPVKTAISDLLPEDKAVITWDEMQPELLNMIDGDRKGGMVMLLILYLVIGFGIFGTAMMMINERKREFGVVNAVGMQKSQINIVLFFETIFLGIVGSLIGITISIPLIWIFYVKPIPISGDVAEMMGDFGMEPFYYVSTDPMLFINQAIIILVLCIAISFVSMLSIKRMKMINALRA